MNWRKTFLVLVVVCVLGSQIGCYGPFNLTRTVHSWNGEVDGKWGNEGIFLVLVIFPVYSFAALGDAIIFNSVEFWTGENWIDPPGGSTSMTDGDKTAELALSQTEQGRQLEFRLSENDRLLDECVLRTQADGTTVKMDREGNVLASARLLDDGSIRVWDAKTNLEKTYTRSDIDAFLR